mgnify:CR=1 FL=1
MQPSADLVTRASEKLLRWRWVIMALIALFNIAVETAERRSTPSSMPDVYYVWEVLLFGFVGPLLGGIALTWLARARRRQKRADYHQSLHRELVALLGEAQSWDELIALVVRFPRRVLDLRGAGLLVHDPTLDTYHLEAQWWDPSESSPTLLTSLRAQQICDDCAALEDPTSAGASLTLCGQSADPNLGARYCLPLIHGGRLMALLYLFVAPDAPPTEEEAGTLSLMAASMAIAVHEAQPQRSARIQAEAAEAERKRIAQDLHDTLGQSLGYLNLKLDQLSGRDTLREIRDIRQELEQMRSVAGEAYLQVRTTLSNLQPVAPADLEAALQEEVQQAARRAGFKLKTVCEGTARPLPPHTRRQLVYLLGEAVTNIERHANAQRVEMQLTWTDERLDIRLSDDGCGFDTSVAEADGHYGLGTMQQRASAVDGDLTVVSAPGSGTEVCVSLPIPARSAAPGDL